MRLAEWVAWFSDQGDLGPERGVWESVAVEARPFLVAAELKRKPRQVLIVAANYDRCLSWEAKLVQCGVSDSMIHQLPSGTSTLFEDATPEYAALSDRIGALEALITDQPTIVIGAASAVLERTLPRDVLGDAFLEIRSGQTIDSDKLLKQLTMLGYEPQEPVRLPGQFSRRGGIVDIYVSGYDLPIRIEFFGDEVESLRHFDPMSQRSVGNLHALRLTPSRETLYPLDGDDRWGAEVASMLSQSLEREAAVLANDAAARLEELITGDMRALSERVYFDRLDLYRPLLHPDSGCALDLLTSDDLLVLDEPLELESVVARAEEELAQSLISRHRRGEILHSMVSDYMLPPEHLASHNRTLALTAMNALPDWLELPRHDVGAVSLAPYRS
jgi:transcription-repair coupling factor (superfamily II helicase)